MVLLVPSIVFSDESEEFCETLARVNRGELDTREFPELAGHVLVAQTLLDASPDQIREDLTALRDTFGAWLNAVDGKTPMMQTFAILRDPEFAGVQGRIADYVAGSAVFGWAMETTMWGPWLPGRAVVPLGPVLAIRRRSTTSRIFRTSRGGIISPSVSGSVRMFRLLRVCWV